jgi:hypothetical protein
MRAIAIILIILTCTSAVQAQDSIPRKNHTLVVMSLITASVVSGALGDGLNSRMKYSSGHALSALSYATLIAVPFVINKPNWKYPVSYLLIRYALFDALYNVGANRNLNYIGGKNYYDESVGKMPLGVLHTTKIISLGVVILLNSKSHKK